MNRRGFRGDRISWFLFTAAAHDAGIAQSMGAVGSCNAVAETFFATIARNPGQIRIELLVDHGGTPNDPSDDEVLSEELVKSSTGRSDDACEAAVPALTAPS